MKPRVVILSVFLTPFRSGAEACAEEVAMRLSDQFDITIVTARLTQNLPEDDPFRGKLRVVRVGLGFPFDKWLFPFLAPFAVWKIKPSLVHAVLESYAGLALVATRFFVRGAKTVLTCQSTNTSFLVGLMHRRADRVTVISRALLARANALGRKDALLIPNGIDLASIRTARERNERIPGRVAFVGRLEPVKGVDVLLKAFSRLGAEFSSARLSIVGRGSEESRLKKMVQALGLNDRVSFVGYLPVPAVYREYAQAEIFCGLSRSEALGNVFLEAQAAGCAVVATRAGGIPDIVEDGRTGVLIRPDDVEGAVKAIEFLLADARKRAEICRAGEENAATYDWSAIALRYAELYRSLVTPKPKVVS